MSNIYNQLEVAYEISVWISKVVYSDVKANRIDVLVGN